MRKIPVSVGSSLVMALAWLACSSNRWDREPPPDPRLLARPERAGTATANPTGPILGSIPGRVPQPPLPGIPATGASVSEPFQSPDPGPAFPVRAGSLQDLVISRARPFHVHGELQRQEATEKLQRFFRARPGQREGVVVVELQSHPFEADFKTFLATLFGPGRLGPEDLKLSRLEGDGGLANPFTEAKQKLDQEQSAPAPEEKEPPQAQVEKPPPPRAETKSAPEPSGAGAPLPQFLFIGSFSGQPVAEFRPAFRTGENSFVLEPDQAGLFNLFINESAVALEKCLAVEDLNRDGLPDLVLTHSLSLYGGIFLGDATGRFQYRDKFVTGYQPTLVVGGWFDDDAIPDLVLANPHTGLASLLKMDAKERFRSWLNFAMDLRPDFINSGVRSENGFSTLVAAQLASRQGRVFEGFNEPALRRSGLAWDTLPGYLLRQDLTGDRQEEAVLLLQFGDMVSVLVAKERGGFFNVANLRLFQGHFVVLGDFNGDSQLDAALATVPR